MGSQALKKYDPADLYLEDVGHFDLIDREKEAELVVRAKEGDIQAFQELAQANLRFVIAIAKEYKGRGMSMMELISEGNLGLLHTIPRFDETRGFKFITYAVWWIRQAILKALAEQSRAARPPMSQVNDLQKIEKKSSALSHKLGRVLTLSEIFDCTGLSDLRVKNAMILARCDLPFHDTEEDDEQESRLSFKIDPSHCVEDDFEKSEMIRTIYRCLDCLEEREHRIICAYFGLYDQEPMTLEQIGGVLGLTRERIRQLRDRALDKIRAHYSEQLMEFCPS